MSELTGLDSILQKSHFKTERKHKYSFNKSNRFPVLKSTYTIDFYNCSSPRDTRTCSFGLGNKYDFSKGTNNPDATKYNLPYQKTTGVSFGLGRGNIKLINTQQNIFVFIQNPSSNKVFFQVMEYNPNINTISKFKSSPKITLSKKRQIDSFIKPNYNPEPSKYDNSLQKNGRVTLSTFKTSKKAVFAKQSRFMDYLQKSLVGPGQYNPKDNNDSKHIVRNNVFSMAAKKTFADQAINKSITPGPVYYIP